MSTSIPTVSVDGKALKLSTGDRFMANGVCLQPGKDITFYDYPLSDSNYDYTSTVILPYLKALNINMIRVYQIDLTASHDKTMKLLEENGIYVMLEVENKEICVKTLTPEYTYELFMRGVQVVDMFQQYPNTLAFSVGNETEDPGLIYSRNGNSVSGTVATQLKIASSIKSFIRDLKAHIATKGYRSIPVGVAIRDVFQKSVSPSGAIGTDICAEYYASGTPQERADFIGLNTYRYVSAKDSSKDPLTCYNDIAKDWSGMPVPIIFSEIGAISAVQTWPRDWACIEYMYKTKLLYDQFSGQIAFSFFNEKNNLGLYIQNEDQRGDFDTMPLGGVDALKSQFSAGKSKTVPMPASNNPKPTAAPTTCDPDLQNPFFAPDTTITVMNYATVELKATQGEYVLGSLAPAESNSSPSTNSITISTTSDLGLFILEPQEKGAWPMSCQLSANSVASLTDASVINNQNWGSSCNIG
ncbi:MAG: hypothetical protein ACFHU9_07560 [Fluviicola sp.]